MFWRKTLFEKVGKLDTSYKLAGDFELWTRFAEYSPLTAVDIPLAAFRRRKGGLSIGQCSRYNDEVNRVIASKLKYPNILWRLGAKITVLKQLLRLMRFRKGDILFFKTNNNQIQRKTFRGSASTQCIESLRLYR